MGLRHVVVTSVTRDDLPDGGAAHWAAVIEAVREVCAPVLVREDDPVAVGTGKLVTIEVLIPDFDGREELLDIVIAARPDIIGHNLETVRRLTPAVRSRASYETSLAVLKYISGRSLASLRDDSGYEPQRTGLRSQFVTRHSSLVTKSGLMLGLGETRQEVLEAMDDLRAAGVDILTLGQYLQPTRDHIPVVEYITPEMFDRYKEEGLRRGFSHVASGPLVRSSYHAEEALS